MTLETLETLVFTVATSVAVLFFMRATGKILGKTYGAGIMIAGRDALVVGSGFALELNWHLPRALYQSSPDVSRLLIEPVEPVRSVPGCNKI